MTSFNPTRENGEKNGGIGVELKPDCGPATINVKVSHGLNQHDVAVPSNSTFGDLKSVIVQKIGLKPEMHKLLFRGKEKEDDEDLQTAGVKDNSKLLLMENTTCGENNAEEVKQTSVISRGGAAVAEIREQVDKLSEQVSALQAVVDSGTKVDDKDIIYLTEMLMRQLLKLDGIEAEGEGKVQRKMEPYPYYPYPNDVFYSDAYPHPILTSTSTPTTLTASTPLRAPNPTAVMSSTPTSTPYPVPYSAPSQLPSSAPSPAPSSAPSPMPSSTKVTQDWEHFD
ncbi:UNVERIFIED_CONTAM: BAG family molecular chaperone regulator 4 [Sesamum radiatum]|uniref:BAG family molecular chaperone regulator 4 n=1 Tax=Sesamum radiatum TaxID=300843 RepID=A0AAW2R669_SESRA